jgi:hypothetical protein
VPSLVGVTLVVGDEHLPIEGSRFGQMTRSMQR